MNTPNKLTLLRVCMIPFFVWAMYAGNNIAAVIIFTVASATDALDGHLARKNNLVTNFGKFMDPIADKLLVMSALILLYDRIGAVFIIIMLGREFIISGFRLVASDAGVVIAAGKSGKLKTIVQMVMIIFLLIQTNYFTDASVTPDKYWIMVGDILIYASVILSVYSCYEYIKENISLIKDM